VPDDNRTRYLLTNHQNQPLELLLASGVVVLGPRAEREIQEADLASPQVRVLTRARVVTARAIVPEAPKVDASKRAGKLAPGAAVPTNPKTPDKEG
jgi:hypothetical protein